MAKTKKKPDEFHGYVVSFKGDAMTLEGLFGEKTIGAEEMTRKLWDHLQRNHLVRRRKVPA